MSNVFEYLVFGHASFLAKFFFTVLRAVATDDAQSNVPTCDRTYEWGDLQVVSRGHNPRAANNT